LAPRGSGWLYSTLLSFNYTNGAYPTAQVIFGPDGSLYGTTTAGGNEYGTVFNLKPQPRACTTALCPWVGTILHSFSYDDGYYPTNLAFDRAGNLYGTTANGGLGAGVIYELTPSNGSWTFSVLSDFAGSSISVPNGVIPDQRGNLYGTTIQYPGAAFELTNSGQLQVLFNFNSSTGIDPASGLIFDSSGNLYGQTLVDGPGGGGTVFELSPSGGGWTLSTVYGFSGPDNNDGLGSPNLMMDAQGDIYGTAVAAGAYECGQVFKLTPSAGGWIHTDLYDFTGGNDGCYPWSNVVMDRQGNLYGTTSLGGPYDNGYGGTLWEITP